MTIEKLQEANALQTKINKAKSFLSMVESDLCTIGNGSVIDRIVLQDGTFRDLLKEKLNEIIEKLEYDFKWL